ncbi:MAG: aminotransferase class III-fold pyridoxal phosphate-dependent enzyme, partial [Roseovarius indicus]
MAEIQETSVTSARQKHIVRPSQEMASLGKDDMPVLTKAEGIYVYAENGRRLIDGPAGMWCTQIGYGRKEVVDAIALQASSSSFASPWYLRSCGSARLAEKFESVSAGVVFG